MKAALAIISLIIVGCSTTKKTSTATIKSDSYTSSFNISEIKDLHLYLNYKKDLGSADKIQFSYNNNNYEVLTEISSINEDQFCGYLVSVNRDTITRDEIKGFPDFHVYTSCSKKSDERVNRLYFTYKIQQLFEFKTPRYLKDTVSVHIKKRRTKLKLAFIHESLDHLANREKFIHLNKERILSEGQQYFNDVNSKSSRSDNLKTLLFLSLIGDNNHVYPIKDLDGHHNYSTLKDWTFNHLYFAKAGEDSFLQPLISNKAKILAAKSSSIRAKYKKLTGCDDKLCLSQFQQIQKWRAFYSTEEYQQAANYFDTKKEALEAALETSDLTQKDKNRLFSMTNYFYKTLWTRNNIPVLKTANTTIYKDRGLASVCGVHNRIDYHVRAPKGTPVFIEKETEDAYKAILMDTRDGSLVDPYTESSCATGSVWLKKSTQIDQ